MVETAVDLNCHTSSCLPLGHLARRSVRSLCSPPRKPSINSRDLLPPVVPSNQTLWRRVMNPPPANDPAAIGNWVFRGTGTQTIADMIVYPDGRDPDAEMNNAMYRGFDKSKELSIAGRELQGCTLLAIVSRKGVYIRHYCKNIAFAPDNEQLEIRDANGDMEVTLTPDQIFEFTVIDGLRKGIRNQQDSLTKYAPALADDHVQAYLIRPRYSKARDDQRTNLLNTAPPLPDGYEEKWQLMKDEVVRIVPKIGEPGRWTEVKYGATDHQPTLESTERGRMLLMYDPVSVATTRRGEKPTRLVKIWSETREIHSDSWKG